MEKRRKCKIRKWDETMGAVEVEIEDPGTSFDETPGAGPSVSKNPMKGIEDMVEQNDNSLDGVINNLPDSKPVAQVTPEDVIEEEQKKKSVLQKLQEAAPESEKVRMTYGCIICEVTERV
jgi:hypothetical protein